MRILAVNFTFTCRLLRKRAFFWEIIPETILIFFKIRTVSGIFLKKAKSERGSKNKILKIGIALELDLLHCTHFKTLKFVFSFLKLALSLG